MTREDPRELLNAERARAILKKSWRELLFSRLVILALVFSACFLLVSILSIVYPSLWFLPIPVGVGGALLLALTVYYAVSEYLLILHGSFEIAEDKVAAASENETKARGAWIHSLVRIYYLLQYLVLRDPSVRFAEYLLTFCKHGKVAATKKQIDRAAVGDVFYLIVYKDQKRTVRKVLSANTYRIK